MGSRRLRAFAFAVHDEGTRMGRRWARTSETHPIRVDFLTPEMLGLPGRLGMTIAPGVIGDSAEGGWERDLGTDLERITRNYGADVLVSLMEPHECAGCGIPDLLARAGAVGLTVIAFPIADASTPRDDQTEAYAALIAHLLRLLEDGNTLVVHCRGGLGRTGTVAACMLVARGHDADSAIGLVRKVRSPHAVETRGQEAYVRRFAGQWRVRHPDVPWSYGPIPLRPALTFHDGFLARNDLEIAGFEKQSPVVRSVQVGEQVRRLHRHRAVRLRWNQASERDHRAIGSLPERQPLRDALKREGERSGFYWERRGPLPKSVVNLIGVAPAKG